MAIIALLLAFGSRFAGKVLTTALGWASTLLFGRVPADRQILVLGVTFGSVIWMVLVAGVVFPDIGAFLLVLLPPQEIIPEGVIRVVMLIGALIVPAVVGTLTLALASTGMSARRVAQGIARGYPLTALLAVLQIFLAGLAIWRKARSLAHGWTDAHVAMVVAAGAYDQVAADLDRAVTDVGLEVTPSAAPAAMSRPAQWLAMVAGPGSRSLVPDRLIQLRGKDLDILIYPMDLLISGKPEMVNRARAAMASRLTTTAAHMTTSAEGQAIEDRITALARPPGAAAGERPTFDEAAAADFQAIDEILSTVSVPYEEWEVLYRQRLQVERDLRAGAMAGEAVVGAAPIEAQDGPEAAVRTIGRWVRAGAAAVVDAAADERTGQMIDRMAGTRWRWAGRVGSILTIAAQQVRRPSNRPGADRTDADEAGEPADAAGEHAPFPGLKESGDPVRHTGDDAGSRSPR